MTQAPILLQGPEPVETGDLHFKLYCKLKVFESKEKHEQGNCNLLAVSQHYGLVFVGNLNGFSVIKSKIFKSTIKFNEYPKKDITLESKPTHISVDFSQKLLAVVFKGKSGALLNLYNVASFAYKDVTPIKVLNLSKICKNLSADVLELTWQPNSDSIVMCCMSDGSMLSLSQNSQDGTIHVLPNTTQVTCCCWSPKGKQIVVGCSNGSLSQYKPDLKLVKTLPAPPLFNGNVTVVSVLWISNYQFGVAYNDKNNADLFPVITIVNAGKNEPVKVINFDDITYSSVLFRRNQIYMSHQSSWNLIFVSSANSIEVAVLYSKDNSTWEQWLLGDASRAELPLSSDKQETFPLGLAFDFTSEEALPWGEATLPPMPRLLLLSDEGVLCVFNVVNLSANAPQLCGPPKEHISDAAFTLETVRTSVSSPSVSIIPTSSGIPQNSFGIVPSSTGLASSVFATPVVSPVSLTTEQSKKLPVSQQLNPISFTNVKPNYSFEVTPSVGGFIAQTPSKTPQVTISIQGGTVVGGIKDVPLILQQQQMQQQPKPQAEQLTFAKTQNIPVSVGFNFSTKTPQSETSTAPAFSASTVNTTSLFGAKSTNFSLNAGLSVPATKPSTTNAFTFDGKTQSNFFTGKNLLQSTPIKQSETKEKLTSDPLEVKENKSESEVKEENISVTAESVNVCEAELAVVDENIYWNALKDEIDHFNSELQHLCAKVNNLDIQVGTTEDKNNLRNRIEGLYDFWKELNETTIGQSNEIHSIVADLMESFAWLENAKSRNLQNKDPSFIELKKLEELDPISTRHMNEIGHLKYYIENQLSQLTSHLEKEWMDYQDSYRREVKNQMAIPSMEEVYKTMLFQLKILNKQRSIIEELKNDIANQKRNRKSLNSVLDTSTCLTLAPNRSNRITELSKLADNLLQLKVSQEDQTLKSENWEVMKSQLQMIRDRSKKINSDKQALLRDVLSERDMIRIRPVKTSIGGSSFLRSLALEKSAEKNLMLKTKPKTPEQKAKEKENIILSPNEKKNTVSIKPVAEVTVEPKSITSIQKVETPKTTFVFGGENVTKSSKAPVTIQPVANTKAENTPLASLTGIVSSIGKETETKSTPFCTGFVFGSTKTQNIESKKESFIFGSPASKPLETMPIKPLEVKPTKSDEAKPLKTVTFGFSKPSEGVPATKTEVPKFGETLTFNFGSSLPTATTSKPPTVSCTNPNNSVITTSTSPFTFNFSSSSSASSSTSSFFPLSTSTHSKAETNFSFGSPVVSSGSSQIPAIPVFGSSTSSILNSTAEITTKPTEVSSAPQFSLSKSTASFTTKPTGFNFTFPTESKAPELSKVSVTTSNPSTETEDADVESVSDSCKPEFNVELKTTTKPSTNVETSVQSKLTASSSEAVATTSPSIFSKPSLIVQSSGVSTTTVTTSTPVTATESAPVSFTFSTAVTSGTVTSTTISLTFAVPTPSIFSFSTTSVGFCQATTTATATSTTSVPASTTATTTTSIFGQALSTTSSEPPSVTSLQPLSTTASQSSSSTSAFSFVPQTTAPSIFGSSITSSEPIFGKAALQTTISGSIFKGSTPLTSTPSTPTQVSTSENSTSIFGQKPDTVSQTSNIFSKLLSDSSKSDNIFGSASTTSTTTANPFGSKSIFGGSSAAPFGFQDSSSSAFLKTTTAFEQPKTTPNIFSQAPTTNSFFGQPICSPFGSGSTSVTSSSFESSGGFGSSSKPVFGQSLFNQNTSNTSVFGSSVFGGSPSSSGGNAFQTTTSSTFGSTTSGPFSSGQSVAKSGFGATSTFQKPLGGFGSAPVFGGGPLTTPTFGSASTFSGAPTFGLQPSFPSTTFGTTGGFAQTQGHSATFENLANQNTDGFGELAQQSQKQTFGSPPSFESSSFSHWR